MADLDCSSAQTLTATVDPDRHVVVRQIGDVTVTLDMPAGCPAPRIDLVLHTSCTTLAERADARTAFGMGDDSRHFSNGVGWCEVWDAADQVSATVFS